QYGQQVPALFGQLIFNAKRLFIEVDPIDETVFLQLAQMLREHLLRNAGHIPHQLGGPHGRVGKKAKEDRELPATLYHSNDANHMRSGTIRTETDIPVFSSDRHFKVRTCLIHRHDQPSSSTAVQDGQWTMNLQLNDKTALVTGSSKVIAEAIALALAREGTRVVVHGRDRAQTERVVNSITTNG